MAMNEGAKTIDPRLAGLAHAQVVTRRLQALESAVGEHAEWAANLPGRRAHDVVLHSRARRIGEGIDLRRGF